MGRRPRPLDVLHDDDRYVAVAKPAGVPVHGGANTKVPTVLQRMPGLHPVHRLDAATSGVLLLAKNAEAAAEAARVWPDAEKTYVAIAGAPWTEARRIDAPLTHPDGRVQSALTHVVPVATGPETALVRVRIQTGRMHQIRRHLAHAGAPILMDDKYGDFRANRALRERMKAAGDAAPKHLFLHAERLRVLELDLRCPRPARWAPVLARLGLEVDPGEEVA
jgi:23S rRNA-/tRNA-specific pseudouridylate synthase